MAREKWRESGEKEKREGGETDEDGMRELYGKTIKEL